MPLHQSLSTDSAFGRCYGTGWRIVPSIVISTRSPTEGGTAVVSTYCIEPSSIRMPTRRVELFTVPPPAAATGIGVMESMRPKPTRSGPGAGGTTTAVPCACVWTTGAAAGAGHAPTGGGAQHAG